MTHPLRKKVQGAWRACVDWLDTKKKEAVDRADPRLLRPERWMAIIFVVVSALFVLGGGWAAFTEIEGAVIATGAVSPESGIKAVQHPDGGVIRELRIREGQRVKAGQVLIVLEDAELRANLAIVEAQYYATLAEIARLEAERDDAPTIDFPSELVEAARTRETARKAIFTQKQLFASRRRYNENQKRVLAQQIAALEKRIEGLKAEMEGKRKQAALIKEEINTVSRLLSKGQALKPRLLALKRTAAALKGEMGRNLGDQANARETIAQIRLQIVSIDRDFLSQVLDRLAILQETLGVLREKKMDLERKLEKTRIRAPEDGTVLDIAVKTVGGVIGSGEAVAHIVPLREKLIIEAHVQPTDIDDVRADQPARIVFSAFNRRTTPTLVGRVRMISPAPLVDEKNPEGSYYRVDVEVKSDELRKLPERTSLVPGMPAEVYLTTRPRTPLDIILKPLEDAIRRTLHRD